MQKHICVCFVVLLTLFSCTDGDVQPYQDITPEALSVMKVSEYELDYDDIRGQIRQLIKSESSSSVAVRYVRNYYSSDGSFIWIDRHGMDSRADTLLAFISKVDEMGFKKELFRVSQIEEDLNRVRKLDFDKSSNSINKVFARLEYNLSRAFIRYSTGQNFGFVNPSVILNRDPDNNGESARMVYKYQFDIKIEHPTDSFYKKTLMVMRGGDMGGFLREIQPKRKLYNQLQDRLNSGTLSEKEWFTTLCNMERCRWNEKIVEEDCEKYVLVNIPSFMLKAVDGDSVLTMRVCCGEPRTKTPLLTSEIVRMELNPMWNVPYSIAKGIAGSTGYMARNNMFIYDKKKGRLPVSEASRELILSGQQRIVQEGGPGNSLGRIVFRFENNFSVYLHHTSSPWAFQSANRAISHGCVRVEKPYELAVFLMKEKDMNLAGKIKYSMTYSMKKDSEGNLVKSSVKKDSLVRSVKVEPNIPVFLTYYTLYPDNNGKLVEYRDVYGYDRRIIEQLKPYAKRR